MKIFHAFLSLAVGLLLYSCKSDERIDPAISLSADQITTGAAGGMQTLGIRSTHAYLVQSPVDWIIPNRHQGLAGESEVVLTLLPNPDRESRSAVLQVSIFDGQRYLSENIRITQLAAAAGEETIGTVAESNEFANGDRVTLAPAVISQVKAISRSLVPSDDEAVVEGIRDFYFGFQAVPAVFRYEVTLALPEGEGWKACKFEDGVWIELAGAVYTGASVRIPVELRFSSLGVPVSKSAALSVFGGRFALIRTGVLADQMEIIKDPYQSNPFAALVKFESQVDVTPTMTLKGQDDNDIVQTFDTGREHEINVLGLYNQYDNRVLVDCRTQGGTVLRHELKIRVDYPFFNTMRVNTSYVPGFRNDPSALYAVTGGGFNASGESTSGQLPEETVPLAFDQYGKIRWMYNRRVSDPGYICPVTYGQKRGFIYYTQGAYGVSIDNFDPYFELIGFSGEQLAYYPNLRGKGIRRIHHDAIMVGEHIMACPETKNEGDECQIIEFDLNTGTVVARMDLDDIIDPDRAEVLPNTGEDRVHINSLAYSAPDDCYVISARHQGVMKIHRGSTDKSGLEWWITPPYGVGADYQFALLRPTNFDAGVSENWNIGQHAASILPNGDIMMFDNHNEPIQGAQADKRISRVLVLRVDPVNRTVTKVNEWTTPKKEFTFYQSNALMLPNGNVLSGWAQQKRVYEVSYPEGRILFQGDFNPSNYRGDIYRFYKFNLYD